MNPGAAVPLVWAVFLLLLISVSTRAGVPPPLMLANVYRGDVSLADYWVSEKYDGVRGYWNGHALMTRGGESVHAPAWFTAGWPKMPMDGELWAGRGRFEQAEGTVRARQADPQAWRQIRFMVFDLPAYPGTFDQRLIELGKLRTRLQTRFIRIVEQFHVADRQTLQQKLDEVVAAGGEGLVLHRGDSLYRAGRTGDLIKLKPYDDAEARVIAYLPGKGRNQGRMGALLVERPDQTRFRLGSGFTDAQRNHPPALGSWVTYRYNGLTAKGLPRFARFVRVRKYMPPPDPAAAQSILSGTAPAASGSAAGASNQPAARK